MNDNELLNNMIVQFMKDQNTFNLQIIDRLSKAEVRIYLSMTFISGVIGAAVKYLLP